MPGLWDIGSNNSLHFSIIYQLSWLDSNALKSAADANATITVVEKGVYINISHITWLRNGKSLETVKVWKVLQAAENSTC